MMTEVNPMSEQTTPPSNLVELDPQSIDPDILNQIIDTYEKSYGERWIGKDRFFKETMPNTTTIDALMVNDKVAAAVNINTNRIIVISVNPEFQGKGLGVELFKQVAKLHPDVWISVGIDAKDMLATVTNSKLTYQLIEDPEQIGALYREIRGVPTDFSVTMSEVTDQFLTSRFSKKGIKKDKFMSFTRSGSLHDSSYRQLLFQNQT